MSRFGFEFAYYFVSGFVERFVADQAATDSLRFARSSTRPSAAAVCNKVIDGRTLYECFGLNLCRASALIFHIGSFWFLLDLSFLIWRLPRPVF